MTTQVITHTGTVTYTKEELEEFIENIADYQCSDNLPKWLFTSGQCGPSTENMTTKLRELLNSPEPMRIDVR